MGSMPGRHPPAVDKALAWPGIQALIDCHGRPLVLDALRAALQQWREGHIGDEQTLVAEVQASIEQVLAPAFKPVFNLTGTVIHTNLGRAPLPPEAINAIAAVVTCVCNPDIAALIHFNTMWPGNHAGTKTGNHVAIGVEFHDRVQVAIADAGAHIGAATLCDPHAGAVNIYMYGAG